MTKFVQINTGIWVNPAHVIAVLVERGEVFVMTTETHGGENMRYLSNLNVESLLALLSVDCHGKLGA